jgi:hypothetical protein
MRIRYVAHTYRDTDTRDCMPSPTYCQRCWLNGPVGKVTRARQPMRSPVSSCGASCWYLVVIVVDPWLFIGSAGGLSLHRGALLRHYSGLLEPKLILERLLGADMSIDEPIPDGRSTPVTGRQGRRSCSLATCTLWRRHYKPSWMTVRLPRAGSRQCSPSSLCARRRRVSSPRRSCSCRRKLAAAQSLEASGVLSDLFGD